MEIIICLIVMLLIVGAVLGVLKAVFACKPFADFQPYANVIYALCVLLAVLFVVGNCFGYGLGSFSLPTSHTHLSR